MWSREAPVARDSDRTPRRRARPSGGTGRRFRASQVALALAVLVLPAVTVAHARLVRSWPANGAAVALAPGELRLCFNELLERQFHAIELEAENGATGGYSGRPVQLAPSVDPRDETCLLATLPSLAPASYVISWRVVSRDGHATRGLIHFRVG